ncbi:tetratricopeptide repeat protein [Celerinatantimonas yamalensis]|uniref:Tetratricopeptide repeat protein n=1 Tax=Celerinatantimonas yamalensis TaxID=559956 RepID=A0ABW9G5V7_9GAMM
MRINVCLIGAGLSLLSAVGYCADSSALPNLQAPDMMSSVAKSSTDTNQPDAFKAKQEGSVNLKAVQLYSQDELLNWIDKNQHLEHVKADRCQLVQDIKARAQKVDLPAYQFLWGDMLAWGVCVPRDATLGVHYMWQAARQGLPAALEQLGRYYASGTLVQANPERAVQLLRESASLGYLKARLEYVQILVDGYGSPFDYQQAYQWLYNSIIADKEQHQRASKLLASLAQQMPPSIVAEVQNSRPDTP